MFRPGWYSALLAASELRLIEEALERPGGGRVKLATQSNRVVAKNMCGS